MGKIVVPGEEVPLEVTENAVKDDGKNVSTVIGILNEGRLIPLSGTYLARRGDIVIGVITDSRHNGYSLDLDGPYGGFLMSRREYRNLDVLSAEVMDVNEVNSISLSFEKRLIGGELIRISPMKVARVIGKKASMLTMITDMTKCEVQVGKNGIIWIKGEKTGKVKQAIKLIEDQAHTTGLTEKVKEFLEKQE